MGLQRNEVDHRIQRRDPPNPPLGPRIFRLPFHHCRNIRHHASPPTAPTGLLRCTESVSFTIKPRLVSVPVLLGSHKCFDAVIGKQTADRLTAEKEKERSPLNEFAESFISDLTSPNLGKIIKSPRNLDGPRKELIRRPLLHSLLLRLSLGCSSNSTDSRFPRANCRISSTFASQAQ
jgi:hypothetical protein